MIELYHGSTVAVHEPKILTPTRTFNFQKGDFSMIPKISVQIAKNENLPIEKGVLSYLDENAEVLHTQGKNYILNEIDEFLKHNH